MQKDGSAVITIRRGDINYFAPVLTQIHLNSEHAEQPLMTCDGMLRETMFLIGREESMESDIASSFGPRTAETDIAEDR